MFVPVVPVVLLAAPAPTPAFPAAVLDSVPPLAEVFPPSVDPEVLAELPLESAPPALTEPPLVVVATVAPPLLVPTLVVVLALPPFAEVFPLDFGPDELLPPNALEVLEVEGPPAPSPGVLLSEQLSVHRSEPAIIAQCLVIMDSAFPKLLNWSSKRVEHAFCIRVGMCKT